MKFIKLDVFYNILFIGFASSKDYLNLTIVHTNDIHSHYDQFNKFGVFCEEFLRNTKECFGGSSKMQYLIDGFRKTRKNVLLLNGGDEFQGTQFYSYFKGNASARIENYLQYNLTTIGNHEFDDGPNNLLDFFKKLNFPIVCSNIVIKNNPELERLIKPYHIFEEYNLGVIGYITKNTKTISSPGDGIEFLDAIPTVQHYINVLKSKGIDRIFGLSHYGYKEDIELAQNTNGLQLIVGGHSHSFLSSNPEDKDTAEGPYPTIVKNTHNTNVYIVQSSEWGKYIGHLDIVYEGSQIKQINGEPIKIDYTIKEDLNLQSVVREYKDVFDKFGNITIGFANDDFEQENCRIEQCSMGSLVADALVSNFNEKFPHNSLISLINGGGIRAGIPKGEIKKKVLEIVFPFDNLLTVTTLTGEKIWNIFEGIVSEENVYTNAPITRTAQFGNARIEYSESSEKFHKLKRVLVKSPNYCLSSETACLWEPLDLEKTYSLVTVDYISNGGDSILPVFDQITYYNQTLADVVSSYISKTSPITPLNDGRRRKGQSF